MTESDCNSCYRDEEDSRSAYRKSNKPLMEKRRRARINTCLSELKALVLQAMKKDNAQYSKLEKADILELTVKHLRSIQRQHVTASLNNNNNIVHKYRAGFNECANEVMRYLTSVPGVQDEVKGRVLGHLANCMQTVNTAQQSLSNRRLAIQPSFLHPVHVQHPSLMPTQCPNNPAAFQVINTDPDDQLSTGNIQCFTSTPVQLVQSTGSQPHVAFVLTSPPSVHAVPLYASTHSSVKLETKIKEEITPPRSSCVGSLGDIKHSAFRDVIGESGSVQMPIDLKQDDPMWRPW